MSLQRTFTAGAAHQGSLTHSRIPAATALSFLYTCFHASIYAPPNRSATNASRRHITPKIQARPFSQTPVSCKKKSNVLYSKTIGLDTANADPLDLEEVKKDIAETIATLKDKLSKLDRGGRLTPELIDALRVPNPKSWKETNRSDLKDLATVIPKGRTFEVLVNSKKHVVPVAKVIASSPYSLNPKIDPNNDNQLLISFIVPPATAESRKEVYEAAHQLGNDANRGITAARAKQQKKHMAMRREHLAPIDNINKGMFQTNDLCSAGNAECKTIVTKFKKAVDENGPR